ncbi:MAG: hypothetical protein ACYDIC_06805 [Desulfobaccales bacterium]
MAVDTKVVKALFDGLQESINEASNSEELKEYQLVSSFVPPVVGDEVWVFLIFQKRS